MDKLKGIDVSKWQGDIDWSKVKSDGVQFAIIRATHGKNNVDENFESNYANAKNAGVPVGAYHYCYAASTAEAKQEAANFIGAIKRKSFEYPIVVDMEDKSIEGLGKDSLTEIANTFLEQVAEAGFNTMVYANKSWFENKLDAEKLKKHKIWIARYNDTLGYTGRYDLWQYSSTGKVSGINTKVDMNYCYTSVNELKDNNELQPKTKAVEKLYANSVLTIAEVQKKLNSVYGLNIKADDKFGPETLKAAITALQIEINEKYNAGLKVDGIAGKNTLSKLKTIKIGSKGRLVFLIQCMLICKGYDLRPDGADGSFGAITDKVVKLYQTSAGLKPDGIVGNETWAKLLN